MTASMQVEVAATLVVTQSVIEAPFLLHFEGNGSHGNGTHHNLVDTASFNQRHT